MENVKNKIILTYETSTGRGAKIEYTSKDPEKVMRLYALIKAFMGFIDA